MSSQHRRYDIDWVRVLAIGLLIIYHSAIGFQSWGILIGFIKTDNPWPALWTPMAMLNVWRIPLLFFVSGMGVFFSIRNRNWKQLIAERTSRILVPLLFGVSVVVPAGILVWQYYYQEELAYTFNPGHLWFLANIFLYVLISCPFFYYLKNNGSGTAASIVKRLGSSAWGLMLLVAAFVAEALLVQPASYELFAVTWHGFFLGLIAFFFGFVFVYSGAGFWSMVVRWRWIILAIAFSLYLFRVMQLTYLPGYLPAIESVSWILAVFGFAARYLNRPSGTLSYLSEAAYPVYILHIIFLNLGCVLIFSTTLPVQAQFGLVVLFTLAGCYAMYEVIKRIPWMRSLFGLKYLPHKQPTLSKAAAK